MPAPTLTLLDSATSTDSLLGGLGGGYFVTQSGNGLPTGTIYLRAAADVGTTVDSYALSNTFPDEACFNNSGDCYILTSAGSPSGTTTRTLRSVTQSAGVLSVTSVGSFTMATSATSLSGAWLDPGDSQILLQYAGTSSLSAVDTGTGALDWTSAHTGHSLTPLAMMGGDRYVARCSTHGDFELWDGATDALLDSITIPAASDNRAVMVPTTATTCFYADSFNSTDPLTLGLGLLSTTGDALSWTWGPTELTTAWTPPPTSYSVDAAAWGAVAAVAPARRIYDVAYLSMPLYAVDTATAATKAGVADAIVGQGVSAGEMAWSGSDRLVTHDYDLYSTLASWSALTADSLLRQRQSPRRSPSRVGYPALRQRQSPFIR